MLSPRFCALRRLRPCLEPLFYEHPQQFSTSSFRRLLARAGTILDIEHRYDGEVIVGWVRLGLAADCYARAAESARFAANSQQCRARIRAQLAELAQSGQRVAIWGGTGKAAAFMHHFGVDAKRFPLVVDSDADKVGTYVPGIGQRIQHRDVIKTEPAQVILIPTQWRAQISWLRCSVKASRPSRYSSSTQGGWWIC